MSNSPADPRYANYNNDQLSALLARTDIEVAEKERMRKELTRRMRDDLLRSAAKADRIKTQERRGRVWRKGKVMLVLLLIVLCVASMCLLAFLRPDLVERVRGIFLLIQQFFSGLF